MLRYIAHINHYTFSIAYMDFFALVLRSYTVHCILFNKYMCLFIYLFIYIPIYTYTGVYKYLHTYVHIIYVSNMYKQFNRACQAALHLFYLNEFDQNMAVMWRLLECLVVEV